MPDLVEATLSEQLSSGGMALARGAWQDALDRYSVVANEHENPEALEGLAAAQWWLGDGEASFVARQRAYCLYRREGYAQGAGRMALHLAAQCCSQRDAPAAARGWLNRAERLLEAVEVCAEHGWVAVWQAQIAMHSGVDDAVAPLAERAGEVGRALRLVSLEKLAMAYEALASVRAGSLASSSALADEEIGAIAADRRSLELVASACSQLMYAWEQVKDFESIEQWWAVFASMPRPWSSAWPLWRCRVQHVDALMWRGEWEQGEEHLQASIKATEATRDDVAAEAMVRLGRLRRRQGRHVEAESLLEQASCGPLRAQCEVQALLASGELQLDRGDAERARMFAHHVLHSNGQGHCVSKVAALSLLVAAESSLANADRARHALMELQRAACTVASDGVRAVVRVAEGVVALSAEEFDAAAARLEEAVAIFARSGAGFETAQARLELAAALAGAGNSQAAVREAAAAIERLEALGACREAERGQQRLPAEPDSATHTGRRSASGLTARELQILSLVAAGRDNQTIADELTVSVRTVERHLSNIYEKLQASGRSARATAVAFVLREGLLRGHA